MINKLYGMLVDSPQSTEFYYRNTTQPPVSYPGMDILVPESSEKAYLQFCADQLCSLVYANKLSALLGELDPSNTYERPAERVTDKATVTSGLPASATLNIMEPTAAYEWVRREVRLIYDGVTTVTYAPGRTVEWGATGTENMEINDMVLTLVGPPAGIPFAATIAFLRTPTRDLLQLLNALDASNFEWDSRLEPYKDTTLPNTRLVAYILNALANL